MNRRSPCIVVLAAAIAAVGCSQPNQGATGAVSFDQKVKRVEAMTRALSLSSNAGLKKAGESMSAVSQTMSQGAFAKTAGAATNMVAAGAGNIVSAGAGNMVSAGAGNMVSAGAGNMVAAGAGNMVSAGAGNFAAPSTGYVIQALVEDLEAAARDDMYRLQGTQEADGATWEIDDATGDVTGVSTADASATFSQVATGATRSCTMKLTKSKDDTTGTIKVEISADTWKPKPEEQAEDGFSPDDQDQGFIPPTTPSTKAPPKFKLFNDEVPDPDSITKLKVSVDLKAQGKASLPLKVALELAGFQALGGKHTPTKLGLDFTIADLVFDSDTTLGEGTISSKGGMKIPTDEGPESFKYAASLNMPKSTASFDLTNEGAKVRFGMKMAPKGGKPDFSSGLYATEDGTKLADLDFSTAAAGHATIRFTNGKSVKWDLAGDTPLGFPGAAPLGAPAPVAVPKATSKK